MAIFLWLIALIEAAFVLSVFWHWFIVPFGLPPIDIGWALGLMTMVSLVTESNQERDDAHPIKPLVVMLVKVNLVFLIGFVAHLFM